ncbi:MAG TPA: putative glycoside hydrolase [Bacillota bacterium]|nr:putative glycoside hydrolase [Bacillota bacterium]
MLPRVSIKAVVVILLLFVTTNSICPWFTDAEEAENTAAVTTDVEQQLAGNDLKLVIPTGTNIVYGLSDAAGVMYSADNGVTWESRNEGLPHKLIYPFVKKQSRLLTAMGVDPLEPSRVAVTTSTAIYLSEDAGLTWRLIPVKKPIPGNSYFTSIALSPHRKESILVGTSYSGFFETTDGGRKWENLSAKMSFLNEGGGFKEEISALTYDPTDKNRILFTCGFGKGFYSFNRQSKAWHKLDLDDLPKDQHILALNFMKDNCQDDAAQVELQDESRDKPQESIQWHLAIITENHHLRYSLDAKRIIANEELQKPILDAAKIERQKLAAGKFGIYVSSRNAQEKLFQEQVKFLKKNNLNAVVIDFKDDDGCLTYNTKLALPYKLNAVRGKIKVEQLLQTAKENGIYVIARIVVFKDSKLYQYQNHKYAIWNRATGQPWGHLIKVTDPETGTEKFVQREYWVDPYNQEVWDYNIAIAKELESLGVDEIQFDYIRFPTDGDLSTTKYRYRPDGMEKKDAIESFLARAREQIQIPISTDLYGYNCWYRMDSWNGQNMEVMAKYVDVICPMFYPSHFPSSVMKELTYLERAHRIYREGVARAYSIGRGQAMIRPYIQAFLLGKERRMSPEVYSQYLQRQVEGTLDSTSAGFLLWNFGNNYYMVTKPFDFNTKLNKSEE